MEGPLGAGNVTTWFYDSRGRVTVETDVVGGAGTFKTQWAYDAADRVTTMTYPGGRSGQAGESVSYGYTAGWLPNTVGGSSPYVQSATYDAAGRPELLTLANNALKLDYVYHPWTAQGGRLAQLKAGTPSNLTSLQDLRYSYDAVGNVLSIQDWKAGSPQAQTFGYDALDRLITATVSGGTGGLYPDQSYQYSPTGNLTFATARGAYTYASNVTGLGCTPGTRATKPHAATAAGGYQYGYDCNGNALTRTVGSWASFSLGYDGENHLVSVGGTVSATYRYDGDGWRAQATAYENLASGLVPTASAPLVWDWVVTDGDTYANSGAGDSAQFAYTTSGGPQHVQLDLGQAYSVDTLKVWHFASDGRTYHGTKTEVSADGLSWFTVFSSTAATEYVESAAGRTYTFTPRAVRYVRDSLNGSTANGNNHWVEVEVWGTRTTAYLGDYYEWTGSPTTAKRYYYAGGQRIAERVGDSALYFLLGDQLGSTNKLATAGGGLYSEVRYGPWGQTRHLTGTTPTSFRYTGQREEAALGLYYFNARWLDPYPNQFIQPDPMIPQYTDPRTLHRYVYANNNPINFTDPAGLCPQPEKETGDVICVDLFIKAETILLIGLGDNRDFSWNSPPDRSRGYVYIYLDEEGQVRQVEPHINPSCLVGGDCYGPFLEYNHFDVAQTASSDEIQVTWDLLNGVSGLLRGPIAESLWFESHGIGQALSLLARCASYVPLGSINGTMTLDRTRGGHWYLKRLNRDPYPSLEIYHYEDGLLVDIIDQRSEWPSGRPDIGLSPLAPNDHVP